jgi:triacylglycerol esterase/lipase EstA (alpha/beta hydrolase family)
MPRTSKLARLLLTIGLVQAGAALAWWAWWGERAPLGAWSGVLLLLSLAPVVLAIEFVLLGVVARNDDVPRASPADLLRAWIGETRQLFRVFYWRQPLRWREPEDYLPADGAGRPGVVFIHGFMCNRGFWAPWMRRLRARGCPHVAVNMEPVFGPIEDYRATIEEAVQRVTACTGQRPILVCHSMGGLAARSWLRTHGAAGRVERVTTIGSPHHGTWLGRFSSRPNGRQMRLGSAWLRQLEQDEAALPRPPWTCWYSNCDNIAFPPSTATLAGADNRLLAGLAHVDLAFAPEVMEHTLPFLSR